MTHQPRRLGHRGARFNPSVAAVDLGEYKLVAHDGFFRPMILGPLERAVWAELSGSVDLDDLDDLDDLAIDLAEATGEGGSSTAWLDRFLRDLIDSGFVLDLERPQIGRPRRLDLPIDPSSCAGRRMGLGRANLVEVSVAGVPPFRIGATDRALVEEVVEALPDGSTHNPDSEQWLRTIVLRVTRGKRARLQQLFDTIGDPIFATMSLDRAAESLFRSVGGMLDAGGLDASSRVWVDTPALVDDRGAILVHPGLHRFLMDHVRSDILASTAEYIPSALIELVRTPAGYEVRVPQALVGDDSYAVPVTRVIIPEGLPRSFPAAVERVVHLAHRWDEAHLNAMVELAANGPITYLAKDAAVPDLLEQLGLRN